MGFSRASNDTANYGPGDPRSNPKDLFTQLGISVLLGLSAFLTFCASLQSEHRRIKALIRHHSTFELDGKDYTQHVNDIQMQLLRSRIFQIPSLVGYRLYTESRRKRSWLLLDSMPLWLV
jgi:hypothetical protein